MNDIVLQEKNEDTHWFVMRDLKRPNAKLPAYKLLSDANFEVFTPKKRQLKQNKQGKRVIEEVPFIQDLLFVRATRRDLDPIVHKTSTLQYRYARGGNFNNPMVVPDREMSRFINAVLTSNSPQYYHPNEITPIMHGRKIRIVGGPLDNYEGTLLTTRGSKIKRLLVELPNFLFVGVEVNPDFIQFI